MDEFTDNIISPSLWEDGDAKERSSWCYIETGQPNVLLPTSLRLHENEKESLPLNLISPKQNVDCLCTQDTPSIEPDGGANYAVGKGLIFEEGQNCFDKVTLTTKGSLKMENMGMQYDRVLPAMNPLNLNYSKQLPMFGHLTSSRSFDEANCIGHYDSEKFDYQRSFRDSQHSSSMPQLWPSASYDGVSSLSAVIRQDSTQQFDLQEGNSRDDINYLGKRYVSMDPIPQLDASIALKDEENLQCYALSSFATGSNAAMAMNGASVLPQNASAIPSSGSNGTGKPRVRARRGHATDPHSIAERLRREKIAERMKSLQELVPDSSKVDKASMLDEIIEYVKFLQLQVKVLSMSRLGAAGAVVPLLTDFQAQGSNRLSLSPSARMAIDATPSPDQMAFEQEVLKLMESNMTAAIQYLQGKGLCLMPMALAAAISSGEATLSHNISDEKNICLKSKLVHINNNSHSNSSSSSCSFSGVEAYQKTND